MIVWLHSLMLAINQRLSVQWCCCHPSTSLSQFKEKLPIIIIWSVIIWNDWYNLIRCHCSSLLWFKEPSLKVMLLLLEVDQLEIKNVSWSRLLQRTDKTAGLSSNDYKNLEKFICKIDFLYLHIFFFIFLLFQMF